MSNLLAARSQMAMSLAFHIIFAVVGMAMPLLMVLAEWRWLKSGEESYRILAKRWAKGTAIMFAVGAVSGTVLSFELGLLWPRFMQFAGPVIGMPFSLEGFAFFLEAIFLGIYLYGWDRVSARLHLFAGVMVAFCGTMSGFFVVTVNAWMNAPQGFQVVNGKVVSINIWEAMFNPATATQTTHMILAAFVTVGFAVAAIHAWMLLKNKDSVFHRKAYILALAVGGITSLLQPISGDFSAKYVAKYQPAKLAAMEGHWKTEKGAPLRIGGWPDEKTEKTYYSIDIPYLLSILSFGHPNAKVTGLKDIPKDRRPPVAIVHIAFQIMVGCGFVMMFVGLLGGLFYWRKPEMLKESWFLKLVIASGPLGMLALQAGWVVTEVGRQPWVIYNRMRTADAVTPMPGLWVTFTTFTVLYIVLGIIVFFLMRRLVFSSPSNEEMGLPKAEEVAHADA